MELLQEVSEKCLKRASELLDEKTAPAAATAEAVKYLVEASVSINNLYRSLELQSRWGERGEMYSTSVRKSAEN